MSELAKPHTDAQAHSEKLVQHIRQCIHAAGGHISFADYMQLALYTPGLGYYMAGAQKFGDAGDFVTAPHISPLFAQCLANQCLPVLDALGEQAIILEFGAGSGQLAHDLLLSLAKRPPHTYYVLEPSAQLRKQQQQTLQQLPRELSCKVQWLDSLPQTPLNGIIIANEVLDAMPVHQFSYARGAILEGYVRDNGQNFTIYFDKANTPGLVESVQQLPMNRYVEQYFSEINLCLPAWLRSIADCIDKGVALLIDYGFPAHEYYHPERHQGTLMCHYQHQVHDDVFFYPGLQDLTAHVDFSAVAHAATAAGWQIAGYTTQAMFLLATGLAEIPMLDDDKQQLLRNQQIKKLTCPSEMGELCKVMALSQGFTQPLHGFSLRDMRDRLG